MKYMYLLLELRAHQFFFSKIYLRFTCITNAVPLSIFLTVTAAGYLAFSKCLDSVKRT